MFFFESYVDFERTNEIIEEVLTQFISEIIPEIPKDLYHYSSLEVCEYILRDSIRLTHARYSNDEAELELGVNLIRRELAVHAKKDEEVAAIRDQFESNILNFDAYVFCLSAGLRKQIATKILPNLRPQEVLSQWRGYSADGRGGCLTITKRSLNALCKAGSSLRINPVIYDPALQTKLVQSILNRAALGSPRRVAAALLYLVPLFKNQGFWEENEWRLIHVPSESVAVAHKFAFRRDLYAPYVELSAVINADPKIQPFAPKANLFDVKEIMIGPSRHRELNKKSMEKAVAGAGRSASVSTSAIPYRT